MKRPAQITIGPWLDDYEAPTTLRHGHARIWYALKELHGGSPHRAVDVLLKGVCDFPFYILKDKTNFKYKPPKPPFRPYLPKNLKAVDQRIRAVIKTIEAGSVTEAMLLLRRS